jgi:GWxTD domain-containing protein
VTALRLAVASALLHFLWEGAAIALLLAVALQLSRRSSARLRYGLACFAMLAMLASFSATFLIAAFSSADAQPVQATSGAQGAHRAPPAPLRFDRRAFQTRQGLPWIMPLWCLGVAVLAMRSAIGAAAARRLRRTGVLLASEDWQRRLGVLAEQVGVSKTVAMLESCLAEAPVVLGWLRPVILIPAGLLTGFPPEQMEAILIHELAHIRRHDYLINLLQAAVEDLLFYHPAVWWVSSRIRVERENCCDDLVRERGGARVLAAALLALEQSRWGVQEFALSAKGGHLMHRIKRLLEGQEGPRLGLAPVVLAGMLLAAVAATVAATQPASPNPSSANPVIAVTPAPQAVMLNPPRANAAAPAHADPRPVLLLAQAQIPAPAPAPVAVQSFRKWLDQEVVYIISDQERSAFLSLQTDDERDKFIEQFWARRDPTPGTAKNEFRDEHERRTLFADEQLGGWQSDRGRIYIMFGPPDAIDDHPRGGQYQHPPSEGGGVTPVSPWTAWTYRFIDGLGNDITFQFVQDSARAYSLSGVQGLHADILDSVRERLLHESDAEKVQGREQLRRAQEDRLKRELTLPTQ